MSRGCHSTAAAPGEADWPVSHRSRVSEPVPHFCEHTAIGPQGAVLGIAGTAVDVFGSKEALFREVVLLYHQTQGIPIVKALTEGATARASVEGLLRVAATTFCQPDTPRGCLLVLGAMNCMPENQGVQDYLRKLRLLRQKMIRERLKRGIAEGDVPRGADLTAMAAFYTTVVDGLGIQARDVASSKVLQAVVEAAMAAWDGLTSKQRA